MDYVVTANMEGYGKLVCDLGGAVHAVGTGAEATTEKLVEWATNLSESVLKVKRFAE